MARKSARAALALSGLVLCAAAFWYGLPDRRIQPDNAIQEDEHVNGDEPITPIPRQIKLDERKVALGRRLFFDARLSHDNTVSCSTCHNLAKGGVDGRQFPVGIGRQEGKINTLTVFNSAFNFRLFWDGRFASLEEQMDFPLTHPAEMGSSWEEVIGKLRSDAAYRRDFSSIYRDGIQIGNVKDAVAVFGRSLITPNGKFDRYLRGDRQALDAEELAGYQLFKNLGCISCHQGRNVGGNMYEKLGIVADYFKQRGNVQPIDYGRYNATKIEEQRYDFRVPSLRNVALTAPYFHDGSAPTLEHAVTIMGKYQLGVDLSHDEIHKIVKFLNTLTGIYLGETGPAAE